MQPADIHGETRLFSSGILDSLAYMELALFVESELGVRLGGAGPEAIDLFGDLVALVCAGGVAQPSVA